MRFDVVAISSYNMAMKRVGIAELKNRLSEYLRDVRRGESVVVMDRETPIARIDPHEPGIGVLRTRPPVAAAPKPGAVRLPPALAIRSDILALLAAERGDR
jgi:prevent-host-death family protein